MNKRPLLKIGPDSYGITIPKQWVEEFNLIENSQIYLKNHSNFISIHASEIKVDNKEAIINFDDISLKIFNKILISYYIKNYSTITIQGENITQRIDSIKSYISKLPNLEIIEIQSTKLILYNPINSNNYKLEELIKNMKKSIKSMIEILIEEINTTHYTSSNHNKIKLLDSTLNQLYFISIKTLNYKIEIEQDFKILQNFGYYSKIVSLLEKIGDILKRISKYLISYKIDSKEDDFQPLNQSNTIVLELFETIKKYHQLFETLELNLKLLENSTLNNIQDKKNSILKILEDYTQNNIKHPKEYQIQLVVAQLLKDLLGTYDEILILIIDLSLE
ncbi:MAG: hypothetical protein LAT82_01110 [Nanoarchaeota archaeon]|nr:hypothetical protein [Nanoarchaeota archaeon]